LTSEFLNELQSYIFNDFYDAFVGDIKTSNQFIGKKTSKIIFKNLLELKILKYKL